MAAEKPRPTTADYVAIGLSPLLIMALVGSLVFFLVDILYRGEYEGRLQYIMFFYIFGAVLVARMSMEFGLSDRAPMYGLALAVAAWIGLGQFVEYPAGLEALSWVINAGLIALVWWSTHRLTYDCTSIDEKAETTGTGLLQAAGLENSKPRGAAGREGQGPQEEGGKAGLVEALPARTARTQEDQAAGRLGRLLLAGGAADLRTRPVADRAGGAGAPEARLLADGDLRRQRARPAGDDGVPRSAPLPAAARPANAEEDDRRLADRRRGSDVGVAGGRGAAAAAGRRVFAARPDAGGLEAARGVGLRPEGRRGRQGRGAPRRAAAGQGRQAGQHRRPQGQGSGRPGTGARVGRQRQPGTAAGRQGPAGR